MSSSLCWHENGLGVGLGQGGSGTKSSSDEDGIRLAGRGDQSSRDESLEWCVGNLAKLFTSFIAGASSQDDRKTLGEDLILLKRVCPGCAACSIHTMVNLPNPMNKFIQWWTINRHHT